MLIGEMKRILKAGKFFCIFALIFKKFRILNIETKSMQKEIRKKIGNEENLA